MSQYIQPILLANRIYRLFMVRIKNALKHSRIDNIDGVQALMLYNIGENSITVGDLLNRKYYLGTSATYNLKRLIAMKYVEQTKCTYDSRIKYICVTEKGLALCKLLDSIFQKDLKIVKQEQLEALSNILKKIESSLSAQMMY